MEVIRLPLAIRAQVAVAVVTLMVMQEQGVLAAVRVSEVVAPTQALQEFQDRATQADQAGPTPVSVMLVAVVAEHPK